MSEEMDMLRLRAEAKQKQEREREDSLLNEEQQATFDERSEEIDSIPGNIAEGLATVAVAATEAVPFADEIGAGVNAAADQLVGEHEGEGFGEAYKRNLSTIATAQEEFKEKSPLIYHGTDFAVQVGSSMVLANPSALTTRGILAAEGALGGIQALSRSEEGADKLASAVTGTVLGSVFAGLGIGASKLFQKGVNKVGNSLQKVADDTTLAVASPKESAAFVKKNYNLLHKRYNGDVDTMRGDMIDILGIAESNSAAGVSQAAKEAKESTGQQIVQLIDEIDETSLVLRGSSKTKEGSEMAAEIKMSYGRDRFAQSGSDSEVKSFLQNTYEEMDQMVDDILIPKGQDKVKIVSQKKEIFDPLTGGKSVEFVPTEEIEVGVRQSTKLTAKDIFQVKVKIAQSVEDVFNKNLVGANLTPSQYSSMKSAKASLVGKMGDILDTQVSTIAKEAGEGSGQSVSKLRSLNKKYALASHLEEAAEHTVSTQSNSAPTLFTKMTGLKPIMVAGAFGIRGNSVASGAILLGSALAKSPGTPIKVARGINKLANHMKEFPESSISRNVLTAIQNINNPDDMQTAIQGNVARLSLIEHPIPRDAASVKFRRDDISATIREGLGQEAAQDFNEVMDSGDDDAIGIYMDEMSKNKKAKGLIESGIGWGGKVYNEEDRASLEQEIRSNNLPVAQEIILIEELNKQRKIPNIQRVEPFKREWSPRPKNKHNY